MVSPEGPAIIDHAGEAVCQFIGEAASQEKEDEEEADGRSECSRPGLAVFDKVWGHQNTTVSTILIVVLQVNADDVPVAQAKATRERLCGDANADMIGDTHADVGGNGGATNDDADITVSTSTDNDVTASTPRKRMLVSSTARRLMIPAGVSHSTTLVMKPTSPNLKRKAEMMKEKWLAQTKKRRTNACTKGPQMMQFRVCVMFTVFCGFDSTTTHRGTELDTDGKGDTDSVEPNGDNDWDSDTDQCKYYILHRELVSSGFDERCRV
ncbi:hypothetical protein GQ600_19213 [Phytophthora cactorum]|nr:hypothetical protein GQ600_19213 [Phytophthora cactorum]